MWASGGAPAPVYGYEHIASEFGGSNLQYHGTFTCSVLFVLQAPSQRLITLLDLLDQLSGGTHLVDDPEHSRSDRKYSYIGTKCLSQRIEYHVPAGEECGRRSHVEQIMMHSFTLIHTK